MELVISIAWLAVVCWLISRAFNQSRLFRGLPALVRTSARPTARVVVVVPMRDESHNAGPCLANLAAQAYAPGLLEIVVVDDHSSDDTAAIVARMADRYDHVRLLQSPPLPPRWIGKSHACWAGAQAASENADWLCFIDADVRCEPMLVAIAVDAATRERIDLLSLAPRHELVSFAERLMLPCGLYLLAFCQDLRKRQARDSADATVTGQFILIRREAYEAVGGHAAVHAEISEDVALARLVKQSGYSVALRSGDELLSTRMYTGWQTLWPGLAKNLVDMLEGPARTLAIAFAAALLAWVAIAIPALEAVSCAARGSCAALAIASVGSAAAFALYIAGTTHFRIPFWYGFLFPLGYTIGVVMAVDSVRRRMKGRVTWKGRTYP